MYTGFTRKNILCRFFNVYHSIVCIRECCIATFVHISYNITQDLRACLRFALLLSTRYRCQYQCQMLMTYRLHLISAARRSLFPSVDKYSYTHISILGMREISLKASLIQLPGFDSMSFLCELKGVLCVLLGSVLEDDLIRTVTWNERQRVSNHPQLNWLLSSLFEVNNGKGSHAMTPSWYSTPLFNQCTIRITMNEKFRKMLQEPFLFKQINNIS